MTGASVYLNLSLFINSERLLPLVLFLNILSMIQQMISAISSFKFQVINKLLPLVLFLNTLSMIQQMIQASSSLKFQVITLLFILAGQLIASIKLYKISSTSSPFSLNLKAFKLKASSLGLDLLKAPLNMSPKYDSYFFAFGATSLKRSAFWMLSLNWLASFNSLLALVKAAPKSLP